MPEVSCVTKCRIADTVSSEIQMVTGICEAVQHHLCSSVSEGLLYVRYIAAGVKRGKENIN